jgi:hypothetical protein
MKNKVTDVFVETGEVVEREMTAEELAQYKIDQADLAAKASKKEADAAAKATLLERLGITAEEAKLLVS